MVNISPGIVSHGEDRDFGAQPAAAVEKLEFEIAKGTEGDVNTPGELSSVRPMIIMPGESSWRRLGTTCT